RRRDVAGDGFAGAAGQAVGAAAVDVLRAEIADGMAAARWLANHDAGRTVRSTQAAAAAAATFREASVGGDAGVDGGSGAERTIGHLAVGRARGRRATGADRLAHGDRAETAAAVGALRTEVTGLRTERARAAGTTRAIARAAVGARGAGI